MGSSHLLVVDDDIHVLALAHQEVVVHISVDQAIDPLVELLARRR